MHFPSYEELIKLHNDSSDTDNNHTNGTRNNNFEFNGSNHNLATLDLI